MENNSTVMSLLDAMKLLNESVNRAGITYGKWAAGMSDAVNAMRPVDPNHRR